jgi:DNA-binding MarR family transcriptional regulator
MPDSPPPTPSQAEVIADRLHSAAIHLLRRLRAEDDASGLTAPKLSALSVVVFGGPLTMGRLAAAEQVRPPTISRLVRELEREGLVTRETHPDDERVQIVTATKKGRRILEEGRRRRVAKLAADLDALPSTEQELVAKAASIVERLALPREHPGQDSA